MLVRKTPDTLAADLTLRGQGITIKLDIVFNNVRQDEVDAVIQKAAEDPRAMQDPTFITRVAVLRVVNEWKWEGEGSGGYELTDQGVHDAEQDMPGITSAIFATFHKVRRFEIAKN